MATMARAMKLDAVGSDTRLQILDLMQGFSIEATPRQAEKVASFKAVLPQGTRVFIAFVPGESTAAIRDTAARLRAEGMVPVPHMPARSLESLASFKTYAGQLRDVGVDQALVIAGGLAEPVGKLTSSLELLDSGAFEDLGYRALYVAGHPEGSPDIDATGLSDALAFKNAWSARTGIPLTVTTQFGFDAARVVAWAQLIGEAGNNLPIRAGVAGPASITSLIKYAKMCGVNASMGVLAKSGGKLLQLVGQSAPDGIITELATRRDGHAARIENLHFYPFGGFEKTAKWAHAAATGAFKMERDGKSFSVSV